MSRVSSPPPFTISSSVTKGASKPLSPAAGETSSIKAGDFAQLMQSVSANSNRIGGVFGPRDHEAARRAVFERVVEMGLRGGPFDLPQGKLREGLVNAIVGEMVHSHYKV